MAQEVELVCALAGAPAVAIAPSRSKLSDAIDRSPANWLRSSARLRRSLVVKIDRRDDAHDQRADDGRRPAASVRRAAPVRVGRATRPGPRPDHREAFGELEASRACDPPCAIVRTTFCEPVRVLGPGPRRGPVPPGHRDGPREARRAASRSRRCSRRSPGTGRPRSGPPGPARAPGRSPGPRRRRLAMANVERLATRAIRAMPEQRRRDQRLDQSDATLVGVQATEPAASFDLRAGCCTSGVTTDSATKPTTSATPRIEHRFDDRDHLLGPVVEVVVDEVGRLVEVAVERARSPRRP